MKTSINYNSNSKCKKGGGSFYYNQSKNINYYYSLYLNLNVHLLARLRKILANLGENNSIDITSELGIIKSHIKIKSKFHYKTIKKIVAK